MINVRIANISPKVTKNLPNQLKTPRFKENFTIDTGSRGRDVKDLKDSKDLKDPTFQEPYSFQKFFNRLPHSPPSLLFAQIIHLFSEPSFV